MKKIKTIVLSLIVAVAVGVAYNAYKPEPTFMDKTKSFFGIEEPSMLEKASSELQKVAEKAMVKVGLKEKELTLSEKISKKTKSAYDAAKGMFSSND